MSQLLHHPFAWSRPLLGLAAVNAMATLALTVLALSDPRQVTGA